MRPIPLTAATVPILVIVTGPPATGKTTISRQLAADLALPLINRDRIKELLFDTLGWHDRAWSKQLGIASYRLLYYCLETILQTRCSCIVESNFDPAFDTDKFVTLQQHYPFTPLQVLCCTDAAVLVERFRLRSLSRARHPGHVEQLQAAALDTSQVRGRSEPLALGGEMIEIDTTDFAAIDYAALVATIQQMCEQ